MKIVMNTWLKIYEYTYMNIHVWYIYIYIYTFRLTGVPKLGPPINQGKLGLIRPLCRHWLADLHALAKHCKHWLEALHALTRSSACIIEDWHTFWFWRKAVKSTRPWVDTDRHSHNLRSAGAILCSSLWNQINAKVLGYGKCYPFLFVLYLHLLISSNLFAQVRRAPKSTRPWVGCF